VKCPTCEWEFETPDTNVWLDRKCPSCREELLVRGSEVRLGQEPLPPSPMSRPPGAELGFLEHTVPVGNPAALWSYYLGLFAVIPCVGIFLSVAALHFGKKGLEFANQHPEKLGKGHAVVGIFFAIFWIALWVAIFFAVAFSSSPFVGP